jgi:hypothetical protein
MMEKYDGVRVMWDGYKLTSVTTPKCVIQLPKDHGFPSVPFEGELWYAMYSLNS